MMNLIELLYFRDMVPKAQDSQEVRRILRKISDNEAFLTQRLEGEEKRRYLQAVDDWDEALGAVSVDSFVDGFRLGARFTLETFCKD